MDAEQLLRSMGVTGKYKGFPYAIYMIDRVEKDPSSGFLITKRLYPETAKRFGTSSTIVERDFRTIIQVCWNYPDRSALEGVAGAHLCRRPTNSHFLDMTASYLRRQAWRESETPAESLTLT